MAAGQQAAYRHIHAGVSVLVHAERSGTCTVGMPCFGTTNHVCPQVKIKVNALHGHLPYVQQCCDQLGHFHPTAAFVVAQLSAGGEVLGLGTQTTYAETLQEGCIWSEWITFCVKVCDPPLPHPLHNPHLSPLLHIYSPDPHPRCTCIFELPQQKLLAIAAQSTAQQTA